VTNYRRNFICGGSFFFTANLAERRLRLLVDDIVSAKDDGFRCRSTHPSVTGLERSIPFASSTRRFSLLYGVGARPPPDGV
jgi:hypothetical protein